MLLPGRKWLPCSASVLPLATLLLPLNDKPGANTVRPSVVILPIRTNGIRMAIISNGAHPPFGAGLTGFGWCKVCVGKLPVGTGGV